MRTRTKMIFLICFISIHISIFGIGLKPEFVLIEGGTFIMGDYTGTLYEEAEALPAHKVTVSDYYLAKFLTSNQEVVEVFNWALEKGYITVENGSVILAGENKEPLLNLTGVDYSPHFLPQIIFQDDKLKIKDHKENYPCVFITWYGAAAFCNFKSEMKGLDKCFDLITWKCDFTKNGYRLPTEAEYEFAARNRGKKIKYPWGDGIPYINSKPAVNLPDVTGEKYFSGLNVWWRPNLLLPWGKYDDGYASTSPVNAMEPNPLGIHDIVGNAWEWLYDWFAKYTSEKKINPSGPATGLKRCMRGGSWWNPDPFITCCVRRDFDLPEFSCNHTGFRIAKSVK